MLKLKDWTPCPPHHKRPTQWLLSSFDCQAPIGWMGNKHIIISSVWGFPKMEISDSYFINGMVMKEGNASCLSTIWLINFRYLDRKKVLWNATNYSFRLPGTNLSSIPVSIFKLPMWCKNLAGSLELIGVARDYLCILVLASWPKQDQIILVDVHRWHFSIILLNLLI